MLCPPSLVLFSGTINLFYFRPKIIYYYMQNNNEAINVSRHGRIIDTRTLKYTNRRYKY